MFFLGPTKVIQLVLIRINRRKLLRLLYLIVSVSILEGVDFDIERFDGSFVVESVEGVLEVLEVWSFYLTLGDHSFRHVLTKFFHVGSIPRDVTETLETSRKYKIEGIADLARLKHYLQGFNKDFLEVVIVEEVDLVFLEIFKVFVVSE